MQEYLDVLSDDLAGMTPSQVLAVKAVVRHLKPYLPPHVVYAWVHTTRPGDNVLDLIKNGYWQGAVAQAEKSAKKFAEQDVRA